MNISGIAPTTPITPIPGTTETVETGNEVFYGVFMDAITKVESFQQNAGASINRFLSGEGEELHQVALATKQAELSFDLFLQVRNKVVSAYEEVMRMQV